MKEGSSSDSSVKDMYTQLLTRRHSTQFQCLLYDAKKVLIIAKSKHQQHLLSKEKNKQLKQSNQFLREKMNGLKLKVGDMKEQRQMEQKRREMGKVDRLLKVKLQLRKLKELYQASQIRETFQQLIDLIDLH